MPRETPLPGALPTVGEGGGEEVKEWGGVSLSRTPSLPPSCCFPQQLSANAPHFSSLLTKMSANTPPCLAPCYGPPTAVCQHPSLAPNAPPCCRRSLPSTAVCQRHDPHPRAAGAPHTLLQVRSPRVPQPAPEVVLRDTPTQYCGTAAPRDSTTDNLGFRNLPQR